MKEFDIEKAKAGAPVCTRDGRPARIVCFDAKGDSFIILALSPNEDGIEIASWYDIKGRYYRDAPNYDLMMAVTKKEGWINIYKDQGYETSGRVHVSEYSAKVAADGNKDYVTTVKIEWEE